MGESDRPRRRYRPPVLVKREKLAQVASILHTPGSNIPADGVR